MIAIMKWCIYILVWNGCIIGNPSETGYNNTIQYFNQLVLDINLLCLLCIVLCITFYLYCFSLLCCMLYECNIWS